MDAPIPLSENTVLFTTYTPVYISEITMDLSPISNIYISKYIRILDLVNEIMKTCWTECIIIMLMKEYDQMYRVC